MSTPTLHDFVLNLLTDPDARAAFELDPHGVLADAGLGDISEADVHEVIPLVMDYAPAGDLPGLAGLPAVDDASGGIDGDVSGAVRQLQDITQFAVVSHASGSDYNVTVATAAGVSATVGGLPLTPVGGPELSLFADPGNTLDAVDPAHPVLGVVDPVVGVTDPVLHTADPLVGTVADPVLHTADPVLHTADPLLHTADPLLGTITNVAPVTGVTDTVHHTVSGVTGGILPAGHDAGPADGHDGGLLDHLLH
ncbi:IniB N-terminal domain-containing protein [Dactylosporangium sp. NPDC049140]|uniref:IniB N-terminal domain-containing protein n=1 Tax=Dactylosporangium sp. NPDC049140 TaxID=3155647 RepID=UPI0033D7F33C